MSRGEIGEGVVGVTIVVIVIYCITGTLFALALVSAAHGAKRPVPTRLDVPTTARANSDQPGADADTGPKLTAESSQ